MSDTPQAVSPVASATSAAPAAPKLNAIQILEQELVNYLQQREQAIANVHAIDGAIQSAKGLIARFKTEAAKAEAAAKTAVSTVEADASKAASTVEADVKNVVAEAEAVAKKL